MTVLPESVEGVPAASPLARYLLALYALIVLYASLYPLTGWRALGASPFAFLVAPLPRYQTGFDLAINLLAYVPLGFLIPLALWPRLRGGTTVLIALLASALFSCTLEALQTWLPSRIASNVDLALNASGGALGGIAGALFARRLVAEGGLRALRQAWFRPGSRVDLGLVLLALWLVTQLNPETLLFGTGDLRDLFRDVPTALHPPAVFVRIEALISAANFAAVALLAGILAPSRRAVGVVVIVLMASALVVRSLAFAVLFAPQDVFAWATPGALLGLAIGAVLATATSLAPRDLRIALAGAFLMFATVVVNIAPGNPYLAHSLAVWKQGHFLNFNGLTGAASVLWPFLALVYLLAFTPRRARLD